MKPDRGSFCKRKLGALADLANVFSFCSELSRLSYTNPMVAATNTTIQHLHFEISHFNSRWGILTLIALVIDNIAMVCGCQSPSRRPAVIATYEPCTADLRILVYQRWRGSPPKKRRYFPYLFHLTACVPWGVLSRVTGIIILIIAFMLLGIPLLSWRFTVYCLTTRRVMRFKGIIAKEVYENSLDRIQDLRLKTSFLQRQYDFRCFFLELINIKKSTSS